MSLSVCSAFTKADVYEYVEQYPHSLACLHLERDVFYQIIQWVATGNTLQEAAKNISLIGRVCKDWHLYSHQIDPAQLIDFTYDQGESQKICNALCSTLRINPMLLADFTSWLEKDENAERVQAFTSCSLPASLQLRRIPSILTKLTQLKGLTINMQCITAIPDPIVSLIQLTWLKFPRNEISVISTSLGSLHSLTRLELNNNAITEYPEFLSNLSNLRMLNFDNNPLKTLPENVSILISLQKFFLNTTQLSILPSTFGKLTQLQTLSINNNPIQSVNVLSELTQLKKLFINNTKITVISNMQKLPKLTLLYYRDRNNVLVRK